MVCYKRVVQENLINKINAENGEFCKMRMNICIGIEFYFITQSTSTHSIVNLHVSFSLLGMKFLIYYYHFSFRFLLALWSTVSHAV